MHNIHVCVSKAGVDSRDRVWVKLLKKAVDSVNMSPLVLGLVLILFVGFDFLFNFFVGYLSAFLFIQSIIKFVSITQFVSFYISVHYS